MKVKFLLGIIVLFYGSMPLRAQDYNQSMIVRSICLSEAWYHPSMDYWNDIYLPMEGMTEKLGGGTSIGGSITFDISNNVRTRFMVSYWSDKVEGRESSNVKSLKIAFTRFRLGEFYASKKVMFKGFQPYIGIEEQFYVIKNKLNDRINATEQEGQDFSFAPVVGLDRSFGHFIAGIEFLYNLGSYTQDVNNDGSVEGHKVSIAGTEVSISLGYKF